MSTTHVLVRDVELPTATLPRGGGVMALITLDNGEDHRRPSVLSQTTIEELAAAVAGLRERAARGEIQAVGVTGKPYVFVAGADLKQVSGVRTEAAALQLGRTGHAAYRALGQVGVPTFAFINGVALGGGLELALACDYRTVSSAAGAIGLPEAGLGLIPGWGGTTVLPRLIGVEAALEVMLTRAIANKPLRPAEAGALGIADVGLDPADFLVRSVAWAAAVLRGEVSPARGEPDPDPVFDAVVRAAQERLDVLVGTSRPAPQAVLDVAGGTRGLGLEEAFVIEDDVLARLIMSDEMRASVYAFGLVTGAKRPTTAPDASLARPIGRVGIIGAGLMAAQIALLVARKMRVPVVMRDLDEERAAAGLAHVARDVERMVESAAG